MNPKPIELYATPASRDALHNYMDSFIVEQEAAQLGYAHFKDPNLDSLLDDLPPGHALVALVVAGMTWNLHCKEVANESERDSE